MSRSRDFVAVAAGGALGALARYATSLAVDAAGIASPWATLSVNIVGCLLMGALAASVLAHPARARSPMWRPFLGIGVLGGFTTFSAFAGDAVLIADQGDVGASTAYVVTTLLAGIVALRAGLALGGRRVDRRAAS